MRCGSPRNMRSSLAATRTSPRCKACHSFAPIAALVEQHGAEATPSSEAMAPGHQGADTVPAAVNAVTPDQPVPDLCSRVLRHWMQLRSDSCRTDWLVPCGAIRRLLYVRCHHLRDTASSHATEGFARASFGAWQSLQVNVMGYVASTVLQPISFLNCSRTCHDVSRSPFQHPATTKQRRPHGGVIGRPIRAA
jgi:hypothetical protein